MTTMQEVVTTGGNNHGRSNTIRVMPPPFFLQQHRPELKQIQRTTSSSHEMLSMSLPAGGRLRPRLVRHISDNAQISYCGYLLQRSSSMTTINNNNSSPRSSTPSSLPPSPPLSKGVQQPQQVVTQTTISTKNQFGTSIDNDNEEEGGHEQQVTILDDTQQNHAPQHWFLDTSTRRSGPSSSSSPQLSFPDDIKTQQFIDKERDLMMDPVKNSNELKDDDNDDCLEGFGLRQLLSTCLPFLLWKPSPPSSQSQNYLSEKQKISLPSKQISSLDVKSAVFPGGKRKTTTPRKKTQQRSSPIKMKSTMSSSSIGGANNGNTNNNSAQTAYLPPLNNNSSNGMHRTQSESSLPNDMVDASGHVWRSKYCVLEGGILYFYRHQTEADSLEAQTEREEQALVRERELEEAATAVASTSPGHQNPPTGMLHHENDTTQVVLYEKKVAVESIASVRSAEGEFGANAFELLPVDFDAKLVLRARNAEEVKEWLFQFHRSIAYFVKNIMERASCHGDIHHHIFLHPAIPTPSSPSTSRLQQPAHYSPVTTMARSPQQAASSLAVSTAFSPRYRSTPISMRRAISPSLSHGHGRNSVHRRRGEVEDGTTFGGRTTPIPVMPDPVAPSFGVSPDSPPFPVGVLQPQPNSALDEGVLRRPISQLATALMQIEAPRPIPVGMHHRVVTDFATDESTPSTSAETPSVALTTKEEVQNSTKGTRPTPLATANKGKYVPPHLRPKQKYMPPHLRARQEQEEPEGKQEQVPKGMSLADRMTLEPEASPAPNLADFNSTSSQNEYLTGGSGSFAFDQTETDNTRSNTNGDAPWNVVKRGGCADPSVVIGSILDPMFIPRKASKLPHVRTDPFGSRNPHSEKELQWEIGAVSECGVRHSNEDAYLIAGDLLQAFPGFSGNGEADTDAARGNTVFDQDANDGHAPGLFCVFDGHCGDHAARFASERLTNFIYQESVLSEANENEVKAKMSAEQVENILRTAIAAMDREFCELCLNGGRAWESGATALMAVLFNEHLVIANLGDARGVMSRSVDDHAIASHEENGWSELPSDDYAGTRRCLWKGVTDTHSPSREDEKQRIQEAGGWITTETEIPIGQMHRMVLEDEDVVNILQRCFADRYEQPSATAKASAPQRILEISRVCGELAVSRALGDRDFKAAFNQQVASSTATASTTDSEEEGASVNDDGEWDCPLFLPYPDQHNRKFRGDLVSSTPDFQALRVGEGGVFDEFLLLACDGLWDVMDADDAVRVTRDLLFEKQWPAKKAAARLAELAIHLGSSDNITVIVLRFFDRKTEPSSPGKDS